MRPRFMNRGSCFRVQVTLRAKTGFNEAPIHESGKLCLPEDRQDIADDASMRPRFMNRGSETPEAR